jgi:glyoxylase I family protein
MRPLGLHHVSVTVSDLDEALAFYTERLGLTVNPSRPQLPFRGAWLDLGGAEVHLIEGAPPPDVGQHFAVLVEGLDAAIGQLRSLGVQVSDPSAIGSERQAFLTDPSGNPIELHEISADT